MRIPTSFPVPARCLMWGLTVSLVHTPGPVAAQEARPIFREGQAQVVPAFEDPSRWIREELWVETDFDSDGDGNPDRVHVDVTRPAQTETEGLRVPVIYETSPYYSGTAGIDFGHFWNLRQDVGGRPPTRDPFPADIPHRADQPIISNSHVATWVPRGFAVDPFPVSRDGPVAGLPYGRRRE